MATTKNIAILTSGGDSQGMNAGIRAVVRTAISQKARCFLIYEGYEGLISEENYNEMIKEADHFSVSGIIHRGGTVIGSARCMGFKERDKRKQAARNLLRHDVSSLCVIGGDGSLTGADRFREEWPEFIDEFMADKEFSSDILNRHKNLHVVGLVGSIDNDFCGTDMTIGVDSALHRILEAVDSIYTTASSHQRVFICEVMGRHCGYLALAAALSTAADYVFLPEQPPKDDWAIALKNQLRWSKSATGKRTGIIIIAEGAIDRNGNAITAQSVKTTLSEFDTRVTVLGHVQRGGNASAFDRALASRMGYEAAQCLMDQDPGTSSAHVITVKRNEIFRSSLVDCVEQTRQSQKDLANLNFGDLMDARGRNFERNFNLFKRLTREPDSSITRPVEPKRIGILTCGAPCAGMNTVVRTAVLYALSECQDGTYPYQPVAIFNGFEGLLEGNCHAFNHGSVGDYNSVGGSKIGANRDIPKESNVKEYIKALEKQKLCALVIIGGFEGFQACSVFKKHCKIPDFKCIVIPATISCNVPGTDLTIGSDTAVNAIAQACDRIKLSASGSNRRVFIVETMGRRCGYLATMAGLICGADASYIFEEPITLKSLYDNVERLKIKMKGPVKRGIVIRANEANDNYDADFFRRLYSEEGKGIFDCRKSVLGYVQQGDVPSPFDRKFALTTTAKAMSWLLSPTEACNGGCVHNYVLIGTRGPNMLITDIEELEKEADFKNRRPKQSWWLEKIRPIAKIMALDWV